MKYTTILLLFVFMSCKNETKTNLESETITENEIDKSVYDMWNDFTTTNPQFKTDNLPDSFYFHDNEVDANRLAELIVNKKKQAGSGLYAWYEEAKADLPKIGTKSIVTNFKGKALAIIEIRKVDTIPFYQIPESYAILDMGTTIEPLEKWKKAHWDFFVNAMEGSGDKPTENMLIVCEWFETIWTEKD